MKSGVTVDDIVDRVHRNLSDYRVRQLDNLVSQLLAAEKEAKVFLRTIRRRPSTMLHIPLSNARVGKPLTLSVRVDGVECGTVELTGSSDRFFTTSNPKHFGACWTEPESKLPWGHRGVKQYVDRVAQTTLSGTLGKREAALEAATLRTIKSGGEAWRYQRLVTYPLRGGVPYQFPLPTSPRGSKSDEEKAGLGRTDILLRRGSGRSSRLRILELKRPGAPDAAKSLAQAVEYAAAFDLLMKRSESYRMLLGYSSFTPRLEATAFVEDTPRARQLLSSAVSELGRETSRLSGLRLSALFYRWEPGSREHVEVTHELA